MSDPNWDVYIRKSEAFGWQWGLERPASYYDNPDKGIPVIPTRGDRVRGWAWTEKRARRAACRTLRYKTNPKRSYERIYIDCGECE